VREPRAVDSRNKERGRESDGRIDWKDSEGNRSSSMKRENIVDASRGSALPISRGCEDPRVSFVANKTAVRAHLQGNGPRKLAVRPKVVRYPTYSGALAPVRETSRGPGELPSFPSRDPKEKQSFGPEGRSARAGRSAPSFTKAGSISIPPTDRGSLKREEPVVVDSACE